MGNSYGDRKNGLTLALDLISSLTIKITQFAMISWEVYYA